MEYDYDNRNSFYKNAFRSFVSIALTLLVGFHVYTYLWGPADGFERDISDIKYVVMQLTRSLSEVSIKHERLQTEMERLTAAIPSVAAAAERAKDALEPSAKRNSRHSVDVVHDYDWQIADYALETAGGRILDTGDTIEHVLYESPIGWALHVITSFVCHGCNGASAIIRPGALPGECWAFKGSRGEATIRLLGTVHITGISIEHVSSQITPTREISSAPRLFQLEGLEFRSDTYPHDFGCFEYDKDGKPIQYFEIQHPSSKGYNLVRIKILSNWGHPVYTCVYRVRVHGELTSGQAPRSVMTDDIDIKIEKE